MKEGEKKELQVAVEKKGQVGEEEAEKVELQVLREKAALTGGIRGHLRGKLIVCFVLGVIQSFLLGTLLNEEVRRHITLVQVLRGRKQTSHRQEVTTGSIAPAAHKVLTVIVFNIVTFFTIAGEAINSVIHCVIHGETRVNYVKVGNLVNN